MDGPVALSPAHGTRPAFTRRSLPHAGADALFVRLFGHIRIEAGRQRTAVSVPNRTLPALVYLLLHRGEPIARTRLAALLRPDDAEAGARTRLRANLHALLAHLPPPARGAWL